MDTNESILNKIIQSKQMQMANRFNPLDVVSHILNNLTSKEREVIKRRFSLVGEQRQTLEEIGRQHNITRERIRQIQTAAIKKIKELEGIKEKLDAISQIVKKVLSEYGGLMEESHFLDEILSYSENTPENRNATIFIVSQLLDEHVEKIKPSEHLLEGWKLKVVSLDIVSEILSVLQELIEREKQLMSLEKIIEKFQRHEYFVNNAPRIQTHLSTTLSSDTLDQERIKKILYSYLMISNKIGDNILEEWGFYDWPEITPKRMGDKVYLILKKVTKPMHFKEITQTINEAKFDKKIAYPATIHNELILDERFVLVGRGIYALKEWGYSSGTVSDVILEMLRKAGRPMAKDEIVNEVLKKRIVKKSTIYLALTNKSLFKRAGDGYIPA